MDDLLRYPAGIPVVHPLPPTKNALSILTSECQCFPFFFSSPDITSLAVPQCVAVAEVLGLPAALPGTHVAECRRQISDHLGCALW